MEISNKVISSVSENPALQSLLYDAGLLPEQANTKLKRQILNLTVVAFEAGKASELVAQP